MTIYQVDAFTNTLFKGNPAAVVPLDHWLPDSLMQEIAAENNLSETVFFVPDGLAFSIRWFTPTAEVDLCGHATLAAAHIIFSELQYDRKEIQFDSKSGLLTVKKDADWYTMNFPSEKIKEIETPQLVTQAFNVPVVQSFLGNWKYLFVLENEDAVLNLKPNFNLLLQLEHAGVTVTAKGSSVDFVSRFFVPKLGINEDPVTGSAHTLLIPYWAKQLGKNSLEAMQLSQRSGYLKCKYLVDRVEISGQAITYLKGTLAL